MEKLPRNKLFDGIDDIEAERMLACFGARKAAYGKGESIYRVGDEPRNVVLLLSGSAYITSFDYWGYRSIYSEICAGDIFGGAYGGAAKLPVDVLTESGCSALLIPRERIITPCECACARHAQLIRNMMEILAAKNMAQIEKMGHLTRRTTREKIMSYLSATGKGEKYFEISFTRQQLADYLAVDRAALCRELSKLQKDGVISYDKNSFRIL